MNKAFSTKPCAPIALSLTPLRIIYILLFAAILLNVYRAWQHFSFEAIDFDASHFYLPYARQLLAEGLGFFAKEQSIHYAPMAYVYPALLGANPVAVKLVNIFLSALLVVMVYRIGQLLYSKEAGLVAAFLFALSPTITPYIPTVLTEPLYFFCLGVWIWAICEIVIARRSYYVPLAGIAFGTAILTRGTFYYFLFPILFITLFIVLTKRDEQRKIGTELFLAHAIALLFPLIFILKNWLLFDYPFFATGSGYALYFGSHPLVNGYEMPYYGLGYDEGTITRELVRLSIAADTALKGVALAILADRNWTSLLEAYTQKTMAFIFVTKAILPDTVFNLRSYRIGATIFSAVSLFAITNRTMRWLLAGVVLYQILIHTPLLYQPRYSVGALDLWLTILSAIGLIYWIKLWRTEFLKPLAIVGIILLGIGFGEWHRKNSAPLAPDIFAVPHDKIWIKTKQDLASMAIHEMARLPDGRLIISGKIPWIYIPVRGVPELNTSGNYVLTTEFSVTPAPGKNECRDGQIFYKRLLDSGFSDGQSIPFKVHADGLKHVYHFGATLPLALISDGDIRLSVYCSPGTVLDITRVIISVPQVANTYREKYLSALADKRTKVD